MRILFVAMSQSVHTARWIRLVEDQGWDLGLFPVYEASIHSDLKNITVYDPFHLKNNNLNVRFKSLKPMRLGFRALNRLIGYKIPNIDSSLLVHVIRRFKPDIIHSLEIQHAGYLTLEAKTKNTYNFPKWIVTNWGSDIYLFGRLSNHIDKIKSVLSSCDYYESECKRDVILAKKLGFTNEVLPIIPCGGGYDVRETRQFMQPGPTSSRRLITLKGYQGWAGRALTGLRAIELCADLLKGYRVAIYLAAPEVEIAAELASNATGIPIEIVPYCSHEDMLRLHGMSRISIGLSISDAISTSFLEAMLMGSFPIQSNTSCADEWIQDNVTGMLVHPDDPESIAEAIERAVSDDELVDSAAKINFKTVIERLDQSFIRPKVISMYEKIATSIKSDR